MKKRLPILAAIGLALVAAVAAYWLWLAPAATAACGDIAACTSTADLELSALDFDVDSLQRRAVAVSPDGTTVVVAARGEIIDNGPFEAAIASFDVASGAHIKTYLSEQVLGFEEVAFSPDGSVLAASYYREGTEPSGDEVHLYDVETGTLLDTFEISCGYSLGLSADNTMLQCQSNVFDVASGDVIEDDQEEFSTHSLSDFLFTASGQLEVRGNELRLADHLGAATTSLSFDDPDSRAAVDVQLQGTLDGSQALYLAETDGDPFWKPLPQRVDGWLVVFDVAGARHAATFALDATPVGVAVTESGTSAVLINDDFRVQAFSLDQILVGVDAQ